EARAVGLVEEVEQREQVAPVRRHVGAAPRVGPAAPVEGGLRRRSEVTLSDQRREDSALLADAAPVGLHEEARLAWMKREAHHALPDRGEPTARVDGAEADEQRLGGGHGLRLRRVEPREV